MKIKILATIAAAALFGGVAFAVPTPAALLQDQADGKLVTQNSQGNSLDYFVVSVTGNSPPVDHKFALNVSTNDEKALVKPMDGAITGGPADFAYAHIMISLTNPPTVPTESTTLGASSVGDIITQGANLYMKVNVQDDGGTPINPDAGKSWVYKFGGTGTVIQVTDGTSCTKITGDFHGVQGTV